MMEVSAISPASKKLTKKAKYGACLIEKELAFSTGRGIAGSPVVVASEKSKVVLSKQ